MAVANSKYERDDGIEQAHVICYKRMSAGCSIVAHGWVSSRNDVPPRF